MPKPDETISTVFTFFNEIGIISQLSGRLLERSLPDGYQASHFTVLNHLTRLGDGRTPLAIAQAFQVPKTTMTHTLAKLEKAGLIRFDPNPKDGRSKRVMLTEEGRRFRDDAIARLAPDVAMLATTIDATQLAKVLPILGQVRSYLDREREEHEAE